MTPKLQTDLEQMEARFRWRTAQIYALILSKNLADGSEWAEEFRKFGDWFADDAERVRKENL